MSSIVSDCPRCGVKIRGFDVRASNDISVVNKFDSHEEMENTLKPHEWCRRYELFSICRDCRESTIFIVSEGYDGEREVPISCEPPMHPERLLNGDFEILGFVRFPDGDPCPPPKLIPKNIEKIFNEGAICLTRECWNAAGTMFRTCLDLASKDKIQGVNEKDITKHQRENMAARIDWLFEKKKLPEDLKDLADCVRKDGNDGAHDGTLTKNESIDLLDFTIPILEHFYTQPEKAKIANKRTQDRRAQHANLAPSEPTPPAD